MENQPTGGRTGGIYIPPFKLALLRKLQAEQNQNDSASLEIQKQTWEALRKSLNGLINKVNVSNIKNIIPELFQENLIRGRGLFARAIMKAQLASPGFTQIYAALIAVINTKLPENGELILKRVIYGFKRAYKRRDKITATALAKFIGHLVNHQVAHELLALQLLTVLLEEPTDDSVEIAVGFVKEVGQMLQELSPQGLHAIFERFRGILHEGDIDKRVQYTIEGLFAIWKSDFKDYPAIPKELDLVEREDQITFEIGLDDEIDREEMLDVFRFDKSYGDNEKLWEQIKREILGEEDDEDAEGEVIDEGRPGGDEDDVDFGNEQLHAIANGNDNEQALVSVENSNKILDLTEQDLINLRRSIYLTIMSSVSFEECCHKLVKLKIPDGYEHELCNMLVECCANERSYLRYYGLMGQRFCMMHIKYQNSFDDVFLNQYNTIHRLETNKLRNVAKFFAHLLGTDALPWTCFEYIKLNERDTTSSSRIFIKVLVQDLAEILGLATVRDRFSDPFMQDIFSGMFPRENARDTRFSINFFTSIGLGGLTDGLREHLKNMPKILAAQMQAQLLAQQLSQKEEDGNSKSSSSSSSSDSSDSSDSDSDSDDSSSSSSSSSSSDGESDSISTSDSSSSSSGSSSSSASSTSSKSIELKRGQVLKAQVNKKLQSNQERSSPLGRREMERISRPTEERSSPLNEKRGRDSESAPRRPRESDQERNRKDRHDRRSEDRVEPRNSNSRTHRDQVPGQRDQERKSSPPRTVEGRARDSTKGISRHNDFDEGRNDRRDDVQDSRRDDRDRTRARSGQRSDYNGRAGEDVRRRRSESRGRKADSPPRRNYEDNRRRDDRAPRKRSYDRHGERDFAAKDEFGRDRTVAKRQRRERSKSN